MEFRANSFYLVWNWTYTSISFWTWNLRGLDESSTEVALVIPGYIAEKVVKVITCLDYKKYLIFNPEAESPSAFECFDCLLTLSCGGLTLPGSDLTHYVCKSFA